MSAGQLRILRNRIRSVENTKKITRAMEMVSAAKLRRFQDFMIKARPYTLGLEEMLSRLIEDQSQTETDPADSKRYSHPFFEEREEKNVLVILISSDAGLCGSYNTDLIELARKFLGAQKVSTKIIGVGKFGVRALRRDGRNFQRTFADVKTAQIEETIKALKADIEKAYLENEADAVYVVSSHYITVTSFKSRVGKLLPLTKPERRAGDEKFSPVPFIYEPSPEYLFEKLIPVYFESKLRMLYLEALVSEHMARMNAMHQASKNAKEMVDSLVLVRNKIRQAIITKEIIEVVSGSRAQKS